MNDRGRLMRRVLTALVLLLSLLATSTAAEADHQGTIVVANRASGDLTLINVATFTSTTLAMPADDNQSEPMYVVHSKGTVFVGDRANNSIVAFDATTWNVKAFTRVGAGVFHMWADPQGGELWVNEDIDNTTRVLDTETLNLKAIIGLPADLAADGGKLHDIIVDRDSAYVTVVGLSGANDAVTKYDRSTFTEVARTMVGQDPHVTLAPNGKTLIVASQNGNEVRILDKSTFGTLAVTAAPGAHGVDISKNGKVVYATNISGGGADGLYTIDAKTGAFLAAPVDTPFAAPHDIVLTKPNGYLYVTHSGATANQVSAFNVSNNNPQPVLVATFTVGLNPFGIEFVP